PGPLRRGGGPPGGDRPASEPAGRELASAAHGGGRPQRPPAGGLRAAAHPRHAAQRRHRRGHRAGQAVRLGQLPLVRQRHPRPRPRAGLPRRRRLTLVSRVHRSSLGFGISSGRAHRSPSRTGGASMIRRALSLGVFFLLAATAARAQREPLFLDRLNVEVPHVSTDRSVKYDYDIVYVRALRAGDTVHKRYYTDFSQPVTLEPGADLMLLHPDGTEEVLVKGGDGAITDPMVSFDGEWVYYVH